MCEKKKLLDVFAEVLVNVWVWSGTKLCNFNIIDLEQCCKMSICLQKSASMQPRTSPDKFAVRSKLESPDLESLLSRLCGLFIRRSMSFMPLTVRVSLIFIIACVEAEG